MANGEFNHNLSEFIVVLRNLVPKDKCEEIINLFKDNKHWNWALTTGGLDLDHRKVKQITFSHPNVLADGDDFVQMDKNFFEIASKARNIYLETLQKNRNIAFVPHLDSDEGYQLLHYSEGYYFKEHSDDTGGLNRQVTMTLNLNEGYEGGLFRFLRGEFEVSLNAGDAVLFPSNFMFPHEVTEITRGERYSIVTWFR